MHSYQPANHPSNEGHRFRNQHPSLQHKPVSPHFRPNNPPNSTYPANNTMGIKPHSKFPTSFILNQEETQKLSQNVYPQKDMAIWNKQAQFPNNCSNIQASSYYPNQQELKFKMGNPLQNYRRGSAGLNAQDPNEPKGTQRRSQSIVGIRQKLTQQQVQKDNNFYTYKPNYDYATALDSRKTQRSTSPFMFNFNAQQIAVSSSNSRQRQQREKVSSVSKKDDSLRSSNNISSAPRQSNFKSAFEELRPRVSHYNASNDNASQNDDKSSTINSNAFKTSAATAPAFDRRESNNFERKSSTKQISSNKNQQTREMSTIERDIEMLKNAAKHTNEVFQKELSKNSYLSRLIEQRTNKASSNDPSREASENGETVNKLYQLQRELDEKSRQICDKNKQIWDKSKIIIDKNKIIDNLSNELRDCRRKLEQHEGGGYRRNKEYDDKLNQHIQQNKDLKDRLSKVQESVQEALTTWKQQKIQKQRLIQEKDKKLESVNYQLDYKAKLVEESDRNIMNLKAQIQALKQEIYQLKQQNDSLVEKMDLLKESESKKEIETFDLKSQVIAKQKELLILHEQSEIMKEKIRSLETIRDQAPQQMSEPVETKDTMVEDALRKKIAQLQEQQQQLSNLLLKNSSYDHRKTMEKFKQLLENSKAVQALKNKEQQRLEEHQILKLHQDYYEKKFYEINRELKRAGNKLLGVSQEVHQGNKLLIESNHQIVLFNLSKLNEKYKTMDQVEQEV